MENNMADTFAAIDLTVAAAGVAAVVLAGIGINMAFKGGVLGKRAIKAV
jgi:hypothetical protein